MKKEKPAPLVHKAKSKLHGFGIFADADLKRSRRIIEYTGKPIAEEESEALTARRLAASRRSKGGAVYVFQVAKGHFIDGLVPGNLARFINHSCDPNCESYIHHRRVWIRAIRDIPVGEELTYDYGFDIEEGLTSRCRCGAKNCVGHIVAKRHRARFRKRVENAVRQAKKAVSAVWGIIPAGSPD